MILLFILPILLGGVICLQIFLSTRENQWYGLILPAMSLLSSFLILIGMFAYNLMNYGNIFVSIIVTFYICNIPTIVLLIVYFACREKLKRRSELNKMNIQDLE